MIFNILLTLLVVSVFVFFSTLFTSEVWFTSEPEPDWLAGVGMFSFCLIPSSVLGVCLALIWGW